MLGTHEGEGRGKWVGSKHKYDVSRIKHNFKYLRTFKYFVHQGMSKCCLFCYGAVLTEKLKNMFQCSSVITFTSKSKNVGQIFPYFSLK